MNVGFAKVKYVCIQLLPDHLLNILLQLLLPPASAHFSYYFQDKILSVTINFAHPSRDN